MSCKTEEVTAQIVNEIKDVITQYVVDEKKYQKQNIQGNQDDRPSVWSRAGSTLNRWLWGALCCGLPGVPCFFCTCCERLDDITDHERPRVNQSTATAERMSRPYRPHAPRGRKSTPEMLSAVRCALSQLQGEPAPPLPSCKTAVSSLTPTPEPG